MTQRIDKLENLVNLQEQYSWHNCLLVHGIEKKTMKIRMILFLKINEKQVDITKNKIDRSHTISGKKDGRDED